jgi:hypothetical protein
MLGRARHVLRTRQLSNRRHDSGSYPPPFEMTFDKQFGHRPDVAFADY